MQAASLLSGRWDAVVSRVGQVVDLEATARRFQALRRVRKVRSAEGLLRLALMYGPGQLSLRGAAAMAGEAAIAELSDKAVLGRLRHCGAWLEHLLACLLEHKRGRSTPAGVAAAPALNLALVDSSVICGPGSNGSDWRLHARYDPGRGCFADLVLSQGKVAERADRTRIEAGQTLILDRGYARVRDFQAVLAAKADFITRIGWRSLRLCDLAGQPIDPLQMLPPDDQPRECPVTLKGLKAPLRLVIQRAPPEKAAQQRRRVARKASKQGHKLDPRTALAAGYLMLLTSLPAAAQPAEHIVALYRNRWQVELGFKRLKTLGGIDRLPASDPDLARTWLLAHLIAAVITDELASEIVGFPPSAHGCHLPAAIAVARLDHRPPHPTRSDPARPKAAKPTRPRAPATPTDRAAAPTNQPSRRSPNLLTSRL